MANDQSFDKQFYSLFQLLGESPSTLSTKLGKPSDIDEDEHRAFLYYSDIHATFRIMNNVVDSLTIPNENASGRKFSGNNSFYSLKSVQLGMTKKEVLALWGEPVGKSIRRWVYGEEDLLNGSVINISIYFKEDADYIYRISEFEASILTEEEKQPQKFDDLFLMLCKLHLGVNYTNIIQLLGKPDSQEVTNTGDHLFYYDDYHVHYLISANSECTKAIYSPHPNAQETDGFYSLFGLRLGMSKTEIIKIWGEPTEQSENSFTYLKFRGVTHFTKEDFEVKLLFGSHNSNILSGFWAGLVTEQPIKKEAEQPKGACFIATACYGNYEAEEVVVLRKFRDNILLKSKFGRLLVYIYYFLSPPLAGIINQSDTIKRFIRSHLLHPIVSKVRQK